METLNSVSDISKALCKQGIEPGTKEIKINHDVQELHILYAERHTIYAKEILQCSKY